MQMRKSLAVLCSAAALTVGLGTLAAPPASAASGCWQNAGSWWCYNRVGAPVYGYKDLAFFYPDPSRIVGYMYSNPSWFTCRWEGSSSEYYVGGPHPYRWEWTVADNGASGWMKDTAISSETNPIRSCL